jgi:Permeases of the drug/metabolite transporter (DMT) superfamily
MKKYQTVLFLVLANLFWAGNYVFGKYVVTELSPLQLTFLRWLLAMGLLFPIAQWLERPHWKQVWNEWRKLLLLTVLGILGYNFVLYEALLFTTPMNAALINSINPVLIFLSSSWLLNERLSRLNSTGLIISLLGVLLVLTNGQLQQIFYIDYNPGDLLMFVAILSWTFYTLIGRKMQGIPPIASTAISAFLGVIILLPFVLLSAFPSFLSKQAVLGVLYIAIFPSVGSFLLWNAAILKIQASQAGVYLNLVAVFTAIISVLLGNAVSLVQILGGVLVFIGVYFTTRKKNSNTTPLECKY